MQMVNSQFSSLLYEPFYTKWTALHNFNHISLQCLLLLEMKLQKFC